tara:strand:+ start:572 stop:1585 length:1014 start_codon:yes stop_codon:yes gene_type:complete
MATVVKIPKELKVKALENVKIEMYEEEEKEPKQNEIVRPPGFSNYGNTCFLNTSLQMLISSYRFVETLEKVESSVSFLNSLKTVTENEESLIQVLNTITDRKKWYRGYQQDAHECILFIIDILDQILSSKRDPNKMQRKLSLGHDHDEVMLSFGKYWWRYYTGHMHPIVKSFHGLYHTTTTCKECKIENNKWDVFMDLTIFSKYKNLKGFIEDFNKVETICGYECEKCNKKTDAFRRVSIWKYPKTLIIHSINKNFYSLDTELTLRCPHSGDCNFNIKAIGFHAGSSIDCGHYYCAVKRDEDWWLISDSNVTGPINIFQDLKIHVKDTYIILYEREV